MDRESLPYLLQQVPPEKLVSLVRLIESSSEVRVLQEPTAQTMMLPVADPVCRGVFYGGELLVSSAIVSVNEVEGWGMVIDEQPEMALWIAIFDGAWAAAVEVEAINRLAAEGKEILERDNRELGRQVAKTRVSFDLL